MHCSNISKRLELSQITQKASVFGHRFAGSHFIFYKEPMSMSFLDCNKI